MKKSVLYFSLLFALVCCSAFTTTQYWDIFDGVLRPVYDWDIGPHGSGTYADTITADTTVTVGATGADYTTIEDAVNYINGLVIQGSAYVTLLIGEGVYTPDAGAINLSTPYSSRIKVEGAGTYPETGNYSHTSIESVTGSSGAYNVTLNMDGTDWQANVSVGDLLHIKQESFGENKSKFLWGAWRVTAVDTTVNNRLTFRHTSEDAGSPALILADTSTSIIVLYKTIIKPESYSAGEIAFLCSSTPESFTGIGFIGSGEGFGVGLTGTGLVEITTCAFNGFIGAAYASGMYALSNIDLLMTECASSNSTQGFFGSSSGLAIQTVFVGNDQGMYVTHNTSFNFGYSSRVYGNKYGVRLGRSSAFLLGLYADNNYNNLGVKFDQPGSIYNLQDTAHSEAMTDNVENYDRARGVITYDGCMVIDCRAGATRIIPITSETYELPKELIGQLYGNLAAAALYFHAGTCAFGR